MRILALSCFLLATAINPALAKGPNAGTWSVIGEDTQKWKAKLVLKSDEPDKFAGYFIWNSTTSDKGGTEIISGSYDATTNKLSLIGRELRDAHQIAQGSYSAAVSNNGKELDGKWGGVPGVSEGIASPGFWKAKWVSPKTPPLSK